MALDTNINEALLLDLLAIYTDAEEQMLEKVAKRAKKGITEEGWNEAKLKDVQELRKEVESLLNNKAKLAKLKVGQGILKAYKAGVNSAEKDAGKPLTAMNDLNVPLTVQNMLLTNYNLIDDANSRILRNVNDAYRDVMAESATGLLSGVDTRVQASQKMMDKLAAKGITSFTDKAGRKWQMSTYTEMAMRTASAHAAIEGHIQTQQSFGMDLMKVSRIGTTCPICARWQGVVLSISGKTPGYHTVDEARAAGLFHPNCKHTITMFDPEIDGEGQKELNSDETVEKYTDKYELLQQQRANERSIRYWKRREAAAIDPDAKKAYKQRVNAAIAKNIAFCDKYGLPRMPQREGFKTANPSKAYTVGVGQHLQRYPGLSSESEKALSDMGLTPTKAGQKVDITGLSDTEAYKKLFGTKPSEDFKAAGGEAATGMKYGKWLHEQVKNSASAGGKEPEPVIIQISPEDRSLSATNLYKKYYGQAPTEAYKAAGGEEGTGMKYGKWIEAQKKSMLANGVVKDPITQPTAAQLVKSPVIEQKPKFENKVVQKTQDVAKAAAKVIQDAKKAGLHSKGNQKLASIEGKKERLKAVLEEADDIFDAISEDPDFAIEVFGEFGIDARDVVDPKGPVGSYSKEKLANTLAKLYDLDEKDFPGTTAWKGVAEKVLRRKAGITISNPFEEQDYKAVIGTLTENYPPTHQLAYKYALDKMKGFESPPSSDKKAAYYLRSRKTITMNVAGTRKAPGVKSQYQVLFHEWGHAVDNLLGASSSTPVSADKEALAALKLDRAILDSDGKARVPKKGTVRDELSDATLDRLKSYNDVGGAVTSGIQDSLGGLGFSRFGGRGYQGFTWGHSESYWDRDNRLKEVASETFAHVFESHACHNKTKSGKTYDDVMAETFPRYTAAVKKKVSERVLLRLGL